MLSFCPIYLFSSWILYFVTLIYIYCKYALNCTWPLLHHWSFFSRLLRNSSVRKLSTWFPINARRSMWIASKATVRSRARTQGRPRYILPQSHKIMLTTETRGGPKDKQTQSVQVLDIFLYLGLNNVLCWRFVCVLFLFQLATSRGKSLVERVVKEQVCLTPMKDILTKNVALCSFV